MTITVVGKSYISRNLIVLVQNNKVIIRSYFFNNESIFNNIVLALRKRIKTIFKNIFMNSSNIIIAPS